MPYPAPHTRNLILVGGKGGTGKSSVAQALAHAHVSRGKRTLLVTIDDPTTEAGEIIQKGANLWILNTDAEKAFHDYAALKIKIPLITNIFLKNPLVKVLFKAAPGIHELVTLGKVWYELRHFDHVIVDLPSTGYALALFQSLKNYSFLFHGSPIHKDALGVMNTLKDPDACGLLIVAVPEETPLQESLDYAKYLADFFPDNTPEYILNRIFPDTQNQKPASPLTHYLVSRRTRELQNLGIWTQAGIRYQELPLSAENPVQILQETMKKTWDFEHG